MAKHEKSKTFALLGKNISYSFSRGYFSKKFEKLHLINHQYINFDVTSINEFPALVKQNSDTLKGMNVTIPYKESVIEYLDTLDAKAKKIGAVNTIKITKKGKLKGYNTDYYGFKNSLKPLLKKHHTKAIILGTGGASKAVAYALKKLGLEYVFVSRKSQNKTVISYNELTPEIMKEFTVIINCTPLGTHPNMNNCPDIPYEQITSKYLLYDLIYNPEKTLFLQRGKEQGAAIKNGLEMLELQAEKAWKIWQK